MTLYNYKNNNTLCDFSFDLAQTFLKNNKFPIFLCVGNSNVVGDLFGALCGSFLKAKNIPNVYGSVLNNVTSKNLKSVYAKIRLNFPQNQVFIIDSALAQIEDLGMINFSKNGCIPAHKFNNEIMGDCCILANVNSIGISDFMFLKSVKFSLVYNMAKFVAEVVSKSLKLAKIYENNSNKTSSLISY